MYRIIHYAVPAIAGAAGGLRKQYLKMGDQKRYKELKNAGRENAGPQSHDRKLEDRLPEAITQCN